MENGKGDNPIVVLVIVLVLVAFGFWSLYKNPPSPVTDTSQNQATVDSEGNSANPSPNPNTGISNVTAPIGYAEALVKYKDARIQLDASCQASPNNVTFKNNTNIMIDNRSSIMRTIKVGSMFSVKAYDFKIVKLGSAKLPATWYLDCDKSQNVATILIQK